jgi:hypothetical protein
MPGAIIFFFGQLTNWQLEQNEIVEIREWENVSG